MPYGEKIKAFANEDLSFYLYQKGIMMPKLKKNVEN